MNRVHIRKMKRAVGFIKPLAGLIFLMIDDDTFDTFAVDIYYYWL